MNSLIPSHRPKRLSEYDRSRIAQLSNELPFMTEEQLLKVHRGLLKGRRQAMALTHKLQAELCEQREYTRGLAELLARIRSLHTLKQTNLGESVRAVNQKGEFVTCEDEMEPDTDPQSHCLKTRFIVITEDERGHEICSRDLTQSVSRKRKSGKAKPCPPPPPPHCLAECGEARKRKATVGHGMKQRSRKCASWNVNRRGYTTNLPMI